MKDTEPPRNTDALTTTTDQTLLDTVAALAVEVSKLRNKSNTNRDRERAKPEPCDHCGVPHRISKDVPDGCIGKAVATGKMTKESAAKFIHTPGARGG